MNLDVPDEPLKEKMLVMKAGNGINADHVATIVSAMFIEAGHDEFQHKLTLQHGRNSTFYLLGELQEGFTFESMASSIATIGVTTTIDSDFVEKFLGGGFFFLGTSLAFLGAGVHICECLIPR